MQVGTASAEPGETARGWLDVTELPTGTPERLPVVVARGERDGPTLWVTGSIHGDEATGLAVVQDVVDERLPGDLAGTLVCLPTLNPAGLRRNERSSYYHGDDPNRYFPDPEVTADRTRPPRVQELVDARLFDAVTGEDPDLADGAAAADALVDFHTATVNSVPFLIRDRVLYGDRRDEAAAEELADDLEALVEAFGLPVVNEYAAAEYVGENLQRSTAGAALNEAGVPAFTVELGGHSVVEDDLVAAGVAGCYRVMVELGMLAAYPEYGPDAPPRESPVDFPVKRAVHPHSDVPGVVRHRVEAGDVVAAGDPIADVVTPHGEPKATIETDHDGYVVGRWEGVAVYENDRLASMAVRDDGDLVVPRDADERDEDGE